MAAIVFLALGCERPDPHGRQALAGTVRFQGQLLERGVIEFLPTATPASAGARGMIRDGAYAIPREQGLPPGKYRTIISSPAPNTTEPTVGPPGMEMPPLGKERIPAKYNADSQETVEVTSSGKNQFDFTIE